MAWNGSDKEKVGRSVHDRRNRNTAKKDADYRLRLPRSGTPYRGLLAGLIVVIGGGLAAWLFMGGEKGETGEKVEIKPSQIAEVNPQIVTNTVVEAPTQTVAIVEKKHDYRYDVVPGAYRDERGILRTPSGRRILEKPPARIIKLYDDNRKKVFKNYAENEICRLLTMKPGDFVLPNHYGVAFEKSLIECLNTPVEISPDDTPAVVEKKKAVQEAKDYLKERIEAGEVAGDVMKKTLDEYRQLAVYRKDLQKTVMESSLGEGVTDQDIEDYVTAANKILAERGMRPIQSKALHKYRVKMLKDKQGEQE